jgi:hypothetical protein
MKVKYKTPTPRQMFYEMLKIEKLCDLKNPNLFYDPKWQKWIEIEERKAKVERRKKCQATWQKKNT